MKANSAAILPKNWQDKSDRHIYSHDNASVEATEPAESRIGQRNPCKCHAPRRRLDACQARASACNCDMRFSSAEKDVPVAISYSCHGSNVVASGITVNAGAAPGRTGRSMMAIARPDTWRSLPARVRVQSEAGALKVWADECFMVGCVSEKLSLTHGHTQPYVTRHSAAVLPPN